MRADMHVVRHLYLVVELHTLLDHGVVQRAAVDGGIGADLDMIADDHTADLLNLQPPACIHRKAETVGTDHRAGMHDDMSSDDAAVIDSHAGIEPGMFAQHRILADAAPGHHHGFRTDHRAGRDRYMRADMGLRRDLCATFDHGAWMYAGCIIPQRIQQSGDPGEIGIGIVGDDARQTCCIRIGFAQNNRPGFGAAQLGAIFTVGKKADLARLRVFQRRYLGNTHVGMPQYPPTQSRCNLG